MTTALVGHMNAATSECNVTVEQICEHFEHRELRSGDSLRSFATIKTYRGYIRKWIKLRWGSRYLDEIKAVDVEAWLRRLPMARSSRAKIRSILSILFNHACRYEIFDRNPMRFVRKGAKRRSAPNVLTGAEIKALVDHLSLRERTLVLLAAATGLRQSELFGLKWRDVDLQHGELSVIRSIVFGVVGRRKTESSQKPVPLHPLLGEALLSWKKTCKFTGADDWIFASRLHKGRRPYWGASILRNYIRPVATTLNIKKRIGWHTFRHTYSTLLRSVGAEFKVMQVSSVHHHSVGISMEGFKTMKLRIEGKHVKALVRFLTPDLALAGIEESDSNEWMGGEGREELIREVKKTWEQGILLNFGTAKRDFTICRAIIVVPHDGYFIEDAWDSDDTELQNYLKVREQANKN